MSRNTFLLLTAAVGAALVLAVAQVPQPWRGVLVAWLLFGGSVGYVAVRLAHSYHVYRATPASYRQRSTEARRRPDPVPPRAASLKVVVSHTVANGRRTI